MGHELAKACGDAKPAPARSRLHQKVSTSRERSHLHILFEHVKPLIPDDPAAVPFLPSLDGFTIGVAEFARCPYCGAPSRPLHISKEARVHAGLARQAVRQGEQGGVVA